jgi:hypothetical protein
LHAHSWARGQRPVLSRSGNRLALAGFDKVVMSGWDGVEKWTTRMPPVELVIDEAGCAYQATDDRRLLIVGQDGQPEPTPDSEVRPMMRVGCAPTGGFVAASENCRNLVVFCRQPDGTWKKVDAVDVFAPQHRTQTVQRAFVWLRGPDQSWRILAPTHDGLLEYSFANENLELAGTYLTDDVINRVAVTRDEQAMALYTMQRRLHVFGRDGWQWREQRPAIEVGIDNVMLAFEGQSRLMLTAAEEVRIYDVDLKLVDLLPNLDEVGLQETLAMPDGQKVATIAANYVTREHWIDFDRVVAEAKRLLELRAGGNRASESAAVNR